jgi:RNA polymerase sigma-70 factor (ECF subfamily)
MQSAFLASLPEEKRAAWQKVAGLAAELEQLWSSALLAWSGVAVDSEEFAGYLGARAPEVAGEGVLQTLHTADLYLACACSKGQEQALAAFEDHCGGEWERGVARFSLQGSQSAEIRQALRTRLFVAAEQEAAHIQRYSGKGAIQAWYRTTIVRATIDYLRASDRQQRLHVSRDLDDHVALVDLELDYLKRNYREEFKQSFHAALRALTSEERNLLRYQVLEELTLEEIGRIYGLHLTSIARRLQKLRQLLLASTREHLQKRLRVDDEELESIMRLIGSRLDVSISAVLGGVSR